MVRAVIGVVMILTGGVWAAPFRAGAAKVDITPATPQVLMGYNPRTSTGVHDRIWHRVLVLDDGQTEFVLVASDLCLFSPELYDEVAEQIGRRQFWWSVTHTHSAPEVGPPGVYKALLKGRSDHEWDRAYTELVKSSLLKGVAEARAHMAPARLRIGTGTSVANINRRARDVDGKISLGLNPEGPVDRQIGLMRLERASDSAPIALVANYAIHGTVLNGQSTVISGDAPGVVADYVEKATGGAPVLFVNGAAGNAAPIYTVYPTPSAGHLGEFRVLLGDKILEAARGLGKGSEDVTLGLDELTVETPLKAGLEWPAELTRYGGASTVKLPVRVLWMGDTVVWSAPVELFGEISMAVRAVSRFANTFYFGYTNGWFGYLPTARAFQEGGYEPQTSPFTPAAEGDLVRAMSTYLGRGK